MRYDGTMRPDPDSLAGTCGYCGRMTWWKQDERGYWICKACDPDLKPIETETIESGDNS